MAAINAAYDTRRLAVTKTSIPTAASSSVANTRGSREAAVASLAIRLNPLESRKPGVPNRRWGAENRPKSIPPSGDVPRGNASRSRPPNSSRRLVPAQDDGIGMFVAEDALGCRFQGVVAPGLWRLLEPAGRQHSPVS